MKVKMLALTGYISVISRRVVGMIFAYCNIFMVLYT